MNRFAILFFVSALAPMVENVCRAEQPTLQQQLGRLRTAMPSEYDKINAEICAEEPAPEDIIEAIAAVTIEVDPSRRRKLKSGWSEWQATDAKGATRPYQLYLPQIVAEGQKPAAVIMHIHGAVGRPNFGTGTGSPMAVGYAGFLWPKVADAEGYAIVCPVGRADCAWWTENGRLHMDAVLRDLRRNLEYPEESLFAAGFSDGGSGCYYRAMAAPDPFAGFIAMNGHPMVASKASGKQLYLPNMTTTATLAAMTHRDSLYPSKYVLPHILRALEFNANILVVAYPKVNHQPQYFAAQTDAINEFIKSNKRAWPPSIRWFASEPDLGRCKWIELLKFAGTANAEPIPDANVMSRPGRLRLGVQLAPSPGNKIAAVVAGGAAEQAGLRPADVLMRLNDDTVTNSRDLRKILGKMTYGDTFDAQVRRGNSTLTLEGRFPEFAPEPVYLRERPTGMAKVMIKGKEQPQIVVESKNVTRMRVWLPNEFAHLDNVEVLWNGEHRKLALQKLTSEQVLKNWASALASNLRWTYVEIATDSWK